MSENRQFSGRPVRMWGVTISCRDGNLPVVGDVVTVRADNGKTWTTTVSYIHSFTPSTGRAVIVTPNRKDNLLPE